MTQNQKECLLIFIEQHFPLFLTFDFGLIIESKNTKFSSFHFITTDFDQYDLNFYDNGKIKLCFNKHKVKSSLSTYEELSKEEENMYKLIVFLVENNIKFIFDRKEMFLEAIHLNKYLTFNFEGKDIFIGQEQIFFELALQEIEKLKLCKTKLDNL